MDPVGGGQGLPGFVVVARNGETRMGLAVDELMGHHEVVIKPVCSLLERVPGVAGATELGAGRAALVLDLASLPASPSARGAA